MKLYEIIHRIGRRLGARRARTLKWGVKAALAGLVALFVMGAVGMKFSSSPRFCTSCHYMQPFYDSWATSSHSHVKCVDCHFPPGINYELERKFHTLVQLAKYVTRQYGTRTWTQIDDASCLRSGCHDTRLLSGKVEFEGMKFDHLPHMTQFRRVTRLRCTSCHSQLVQGEHMTVTKSSCYLCHFKSPALEADGEALPAAEAPLSRCTMCHSFPIATKGNAFDHGAVQQRNIACDECHARVTHGDGAVPRDRCQLCHSRAEHVERYSDVTFIHEQHVTERKIECTHCHAAIQHGGGAQPARQSFSHVGKCASCHQDQHETVTALYTGRGLPGRVASGSPDPMHKAGVTCEACHRTGGGKGKGPHGGMAHTSAAGCMMCHGEKYGAYLAQWRAEFGQPVQALRQALATAQRQLTAREGRETLARAAAMVDFVREARGVHNPPYARTLLQTAAREANDALRQAGVAYRVPAPKAPASPLGNACTSCHTDLPGTVRVFGAAFSHARHVGSAQLTCEQCHEDLPVQHAGHGRGKLGADGCRKCHQQRASSPHPAKWLAQHGGKAKKGSAECAVCHAPSQCNACHGAAMPHPQAWKAQHGTAARANEKTCDRCHAKTDCTTCHASQRPHKTGWIKAHGKQSMSNPQNCRICHTQASCRQCHSDMKSAHDARWRKSHVTQAGKENHCALCHTSTKEKTSCATCHGVAMPHPEGFTLEHAAIAGFKKDASCFRCHDRAKFCGECHEVPD